MDNSDRAARAAHAMNAYAEQVGDEEWSAESTLVDLLADLHHLCDELTLNMGDMQRMAAMHHTDETNGLSEAQDQETRVLKQIHDFMYRDTDTGKIEPDQEVNGGDLVDLVTQLIPAREGPWT